MGAGKSYPSMTANLNDFMVEFDGPDDFLHPHNWPLRKKTSGHNHWHDDQCDKWMLTESRFRIAQACILSFSAWLGGFNSAVSSAAAPVIMKVFEFGEEVASLGAALFVLEFATGPVIWASGSELYGRRPSILVGMLGFAIFSISTVVSKDTQTLMISRFFSGLFSASPITLVSAILGDMFASSQRGITISLYTMAVFGGPFTAPSVGGFVVNSYLGWRWCFFFPAIFGFGMLIFCFLFVQETYPPILFVGKAYVLRHQTQSWGIHAKQEEVEIDIWELLTTNLSRPLGFCYALLEAFPLVFEDVHGMTGGLLGLFSSSVSSLHTNRKVKANHYVAVPEWRLLPCVVGEIVFAMGLFWFGWTGVLPSIPPNSTYGGWHFCWIWGYHNFYAGVELSSGRIFDILRFCFCCEHILRCLFAAVFPLFTRQMFQTMGIQWASTLLGCIATVMIPIPLFFIIFGARIRAKSRFR
ncbi:uncharacterized protein N7483_005807 [Penicillium malachiteum]|uniref:uncharacterized protein n=1 Tax=Penicillium malachiteum TaxID=1324776 RepID=UPI002548F9FC|nr:uncharacterized protein N7483_005807 [Penicillium malachiteum]KAJ5731299.1 hypothetical protein N7483_005807 [Penicillium malachiteum]